MTYACFEKTLAFRFHEFKMRRDSLKRPHRRRGAAVKNRLETVKRWEGNHLTSQFLGVNRLIASRQNAQRLASRKSGGGPDRRAVPGSFTPSGTHVAVMPSSWELALRLSHGNALTLT
jgi:hypothetical protein